MKLLPIIWKQQIERYSNGKNATIGGVKVGSIHYNGIDRNDALRYVANCTLPNVKNSGHIGKYPTEKEAMAEVERIVYVWFDKVLTS